MDYKKAGVDIEAGYKAVSLMKEHIASTMRPEVLTDIGGFSGAFSMKKFVGMEEPTLVSGTDGVGTKLKLAFILDKHDTIGFISQFWSKCHRESLPINSSSVQYNTSMVQDASF